MTPRIITLLLLLAALVGYQLAQRTMPAGANPFAVVAVAYFIGLIACAVLAPQFGRPLVMTDLRLFQRGSIWLLAASIVGIEIGYLLTYRAGWTLAVTTGVTYAASTVLLTIIGAAYFSEGISWRGVVGLAMAMGGMWLLVFPVRSG